MARSHRRGARALGALAVAIVVLPLAISAARVLAHQSFAINGDDALIELRVRDVGAHTPLVGSYQRYGFNHPGPLLFYVLSVPYRLLGSSFAGLQAGALLLNAVAVTGIGLVASRRGGLTGCLWSLGLVAVLVHALGPARLSDPWEPNVLILPGALLLLLAFDAAAGRTWALPLVAGVASLIAQASATMAPFALGLLAWSAVTLLVRPGLRRGVWPGVRRSVLRPALVSVAVVAVLWTPPLLDAARHEPGNLEAMWRFFAKPHRTLGVGDAYRTVALQLDHRVGGFNVADAIARDGHQGHLHAAFVTIGRRAVADAPRLREPVLVRSTANLRIALGGNGAGVDVLALALERAGVDVVVDARLANRFGEHRARPARAASELRLVAADAARRLPKWRVVTTVDPLPRADRALLDEVEAKVRAGSARAGLAAVRARVRDDPGFRAFAARYKAIEKLPRLTLLARDRRTR